MRVTFAAGIFDMLHRGHLNLLRKMNQEGDRVIVVVPDDQSCYRIKDKFPVQHLAHRVRNLYHSGLVDRVLISRSTDPHREFHGIIRRYRKHDLLYIRGDDLIDDFPGKWKLEQHAVPIWYVRYTPGVSSSQLREDL